MDMVLVGELYIRHKNWRRMDALLGNAPLSFLLLFWKGVYHKFKAKHELSFGENIFLLEYIPFPEGMLCNWKQTGWSKSCHSCTKWWNLLLSASSPLSPGRYHTIFDKGENLCDFLFAFLYTELFQGEQIRTF